MAGKRRDWLSKRDGCEGASHTWLRELPITKKCTARNYDSFQAKTGWIAPELPTRVRGPVQGQVHRDVNI